MTNQMIQEATPQFKKELFELLLAIWEYEFVPEEMKRDLIKPTFKNKGFEYLVKYYRPISLLSTIFKLLQKMIYQRIRKWNTEQPNGSLMSLAAYGCIAGRSRHMLVWTLNATSITKLNSGTKQLFLFGSDVKGAYPNTQTSSTDYFVWKRGLRGKMWRMCSNMESNQSGILMINGKKSKMRKHCNGLFQGAISSPDRWNFTTAPFQRATTKELIGTHVENLLIPP